MAKLANGNEPLAMLESPQSADRALMHSFIDGRDHMKSELETNEEASSWRRGAYRHF